MGCRLQQKSMILNDLDRGRNCRLLSVSWLLCICKWQMLSWANYPRFSSQWSRWSCLIIQEKGKLKGIYDGLQAVIIFPKKIFCNIILPESLLATVSLHFLNHLLGELEIAYASFQSSLWSSCCTFLVIIWLFDRYVAVQLYSRNVKFAFLSHSTGN